MHLPLNLEPLVGGPVCHYLPGEVGPLSQGGNFHSPCPGIQTYPALRSPFSRGWGCWQEFFPLARFPGQQGTSKSKQSRPTCAKKTPGDYLRMYRPTPPPLPAVTSRWVLREPGSASALAHLHSTPQPTHTHVQTTYW